VFARETLRLKMKKLFEKVVTGSFYALLMQISIVVTGVVTTALLTRWLGAEQYGVYALAMSLFMISSKVSLMGMNNGLLRFFPVYKNKTGEFSGLIFTAFGVVLLMSFIVMVFHLMTAKTFANSVFNIPEFYTVMINFALLLPLIACIQLVASVCQARKQVFEYLKISQLYEKFFLLILVSFFFLCGFGIDMAVFAFCLSIFFVFIIALSFFRKNIFPFIEKKKAVYNFKELINFSAPSFLIGFSFIFLMQIDRVMIGAFMDSYNVGIYAVCARIALFMNIILSSLNTVFVPYISDLYFGDNKKELSLILKSATRWVWVLSILLFVFFFFGSEYILGIFGKEFPSGSTAFIILSFFFLVNCGCGSNGFMLQMTGNQYVELFNSVFILILNTILNMVLVPRHGIVGAAMATGASMLFINFFRTVALYRITRIHPFSGGWMKTSIIFVLCFMIALGFGKYLQSEIMSRVVGFMIFMITYCTGIFVYVFSDEDKKMFAKIRNRKTVT
jgi:O-antigen/teichoic acid export membrane protein